MDLALLFFLSLMTEVFGGKNDFGKPRIRLFYPSRGQPKEYTRATIECTVTTNTPKMVEVWILRNGLTFPSNHRFTFHQPERCITRRQKCVTLTINPVLWIDILPVYKCGARHWGNATRVKSSEFNLNVSYVKFTYESHGHSLGESVYCVCKICNIFKSYSFDTVWLSWIDDPINKKTNKNTRRIPVGQTWTYQPSMRSQDFGNYTCHSYFRKNGQTYEKIHVVSLYKIGSDLPYVEGHTYRGSVGTRFRCEVMHKANVGEVIKEIFWVRNNVIVTSRDFTMQTIFDQPPNNENVVGSYLDVNTGTKGYFQCYVKFRGRKLYCPGYFSAEPNRGGKESQSHGWVKQSAPSRWDMERYMDFKCEHKTSYIGHNTTVTVISNAVPTVNLSSRASVEGKYVSLECETSSRENNMRVEWLKDGKRLLKNLGLKIFFNPVRKEDAGKYTCSVTNAKGTGNATATLTVYYIPIVTMQDVTVSQHNSAVFVCQTDANPRVTKWQWRNVTSGQILNTTGPRLIIPMAHLSGPGRYTCIANNKFGTGRASASLLVAGREFVSSPIPQSTVEGSKITMECRVAGKVRKTIKWWAGNQLISTNTSMSPSLKVKAYKINFKAYRKHNIYDLIINPVAMHHAARYKCQYGTAAATADLSVYGSPRDTKIKLKDPKETYQERDIAWFTLESRGYPYPAFKMFVGSQLLTGSGVRFIPIIVPKKSSGITYCNVTVILSRVYHQKPITCEAYNKFGKKRSANSINIVILFKPIITPIDDIKIKEGKAIKLTCEYKANPPGIFVGWQKNSVRIQNQNDKVLIIKNSSSEDSGVYRCAVNNSEGLSTSSTNVHVEVKGERFLGGDNKRGVNTKTLVLAIIILLVVVVIPCMLIALYMYFASVERRKKMMEAEEYSLYEMTMSYMDCPGNQIKSQTTYPQPPTVTVYEVPSFGSYSSTSPTSSATDTDSEGKKKIKKKEAKLRKVAYDTDSMTETDTEDKKKRKKTKKRKKKMSITSSQGDNQSTSSVQSVSKTALKDQTSTTDTSVQDVLNKRENGQVCDKKSLTNATAEKNVKRKKKKRRKRNKKKRSAKGSQTDFHGYDGQNSNKPNTVVDRDECRTSEGDLQKRPKDEIIQVDDEGFYNC